MTVRYHTDEPLSFLREWLAIHPPVDPKPLCTHVVQSPAKSAGVHRTTSVRYGADGKIVITEKPSQLGLFGSAA